MSFKNKVRSLVCCASIFLGVNNIVNAMIPKPDFLNISHISSLLSSNSKSNNYIVFVREDVSDTSANLNEDIDMWINQCDKCKGNLENICFARFDKGKKKNIVNIYNDSKDHWCKSCMTEHLRKRLNEIIDDCGSNPHMRNSIKSRVDYPCEYINLKCYYCNENKVTRNYHLYNDKYCCKKCFKQIKLNDSFNKDKVKKVESYINVDGLFDNIASSNNSIHEYRIINLFP